MRGGAGGFKDYGEEGRLQRAAQKKAEKRERVDEFNEQQDEEWEAAGSPGGRPPKKVQSIPRGWKVGMPTGWETRLPAPRKSRASSTPAAKRGPALPPGFTRRDQWANLPVSKKMKGPEPRDGFRRRREWANLPITKGMKGPKGPKGNYYGINAHKATKQKGLTLPPGVSLRSTKAAKASLFQPKGLPAPAAALPKIQPKALPKYRAAKAAKAKTPRKKAAPKPPKCVNGVVHVKAYTRKCGTKKPAGQAGKGIGSKLKTAAKIAGAAALAALAYKNRHVPGEMMFGYNWDRAMKAPVGTALATAAKRGYNSLVIPGIKQSGLIGGSRRRKAAPRKTKGRGIWDKIKKGAKTAAAVALPVAAAAAAYKLGTKGYNTARQIQDYAVPLQNAGVPTMAAYKQGYNMWKMPKPWSASGRRRATQKRRGRGIESKIKTGLKTAAKVGGLALLASLAHKGYKANQAWKNYKPMSQTEAILKLGQMGLHH